MSNVVGLRGGEIRPLGEANPDVVAELERLLEMARSGEIKGTMIAVLHADDCVSGSRRGESSYRLTGLLMKLIHDYCAAIEA
jgi:hypothetical protein